MHQLRPSRETLLVLGLAGLLAVLAVAFGRAHVGEPAHLPLFPVPWWAVAVAFAAVESVCLHLEARREATAVSLSELPLALGLFLATPCDLLVGRLVGSVLVFALLRRSSALKTVFNLALVSAETCVALAVFSAVAAWSQGLDPVSWVAVHAAVVVAQAVTTVFLGLVISVYEDDLRPRQLLRAAVVGQRAAPMVVTLALVALTSLSADLRSALLLAASAVVLLAVYRAYSALFDRHLNLERVLRFSQAVTSSPGVDQVLSSVLSQARELLHAERAEALLPAPGGGLARVRAGADGALHRSVEPVRPEERWLLDAVVGGGAPVLVPRGTHEAEQVRWLEREGLRDAVAVPLRGGEGTGGVLVVAERSGDVRTFDTGDALLLEAVANHAGTALRNGELVDRLRYDALHDGLTGLANRAALHRRIEAALEDVRDGRAAAAAVLVLDLDGFKDVNDTLGHEQGDRLLVEVGERLRRAVGPAAVVARLGGDEYAVLLTGDVDAAGAAGAASAVLAALEEPVALGGTEVEVGGSVGIALAPEHAADAAVLLKRADAAMSQAKGSGRGLRLYEAESDAGSARRLAMVPELRAALQHGDVQVHVQPKALLRTGEVVGVEALVRWEHPVLGRVPPDEFVPVAERSGLIGALTSRVLEASIGACARWRAEGADVGVAVNLSPRSLRGTDVVDEVARLLRRHDLPADRLTLEITEGSVMADPARAVAVLHELRALGVHLSVDDFGTGYSSLSYLKRLPVHELKVDRSFVTGLRGGGEDVPIVRSVVDLGRHLGLQVVAEGVEDQETWDLLAALGCDLVQGWHLGRPMPVDDFLPWLRARSAAVGAVQHLR